ncbi:hypothetical protein LCGC14_1472010, partial [marine sediment metagenome]
LLGYDKAIDRIKKGLADYFEKEELKEFKITGLGNRNIKKQFLEECCIKKNLVDINKNEMVKINN